MSGFAFKAIGFLIVVGAIFFGGFFVGGGFATGTVQDTQRDDIVQCLEDGPLKTAEDVDACLGIAAGGDR